MNKKIEQAPFEANHQFLKEHKVKFSNGVNRREFLYLAAGGALAAMPFSGCESGLAGSKKTAKQPNIIFIMADDLGYGDLGSYGQKEIKTPNIDELAVEGIRFTDCYAGSTVCAIAKCPDDRSAHGPYARPEQYGQNRRYTCCG